MSFGGAFKDNAIIPYEGIAGSELDPRQRQVLLDLTERYLSTLPPGPLRARMSDVERHIAQTHFCWAGGIDEESAFYYRIQSPVVMIEFDHHKGVLLNNETPQRFHIHTIVRTPNGNDYGMDLLRLHYETAPHHQKQLRRALIAGLWSRSACQVLWLLVQLAQAVGSFSDEFGYCECSPAIFTASAHWATSSLMVAANSSGVSPIVVTPMRARRLMKSGSLAARAISAAI